MTDSDTNYTHDWDGMRNGLYKVFLWPQSQRKSCSLVTTTQNILAELWHQRLGRVSNKIIALTVDIVRGLPLIPPNQRGQRDACLKTKSTRSHSPSSTNRVTKPLDLIHTDLVGPMKYPSTTGARNFILLYDDAIGLSIVRIRRFKCANDMITELESASHTKRE